ncbi:pupal cuticle protein 20-like [Anthonomus grandis grandis]|uniref:pupal cuticle protein 20-like n=1 Tax=Anthonomus grandis grandis TaxID=2921223 RepID=UPI002166AB1C|nr:pupal cuticle protein 20-like [Anthonomus grandis grandis]
MAFIQFLAVSICIVFAYAFPERYERGFANSEYYQPNPISQIPILHMENKNNGDGAYQFAYETGNKIAQQESGDGQKAKGSYAYVAPDGQQVSMSYVADATGFHPHGSHMPVAPPMPELIKRAVEQNLADEARGIIDDGQYRETQAHLPAPALPVQYRV